MRLDETSAICRGLINNLKPRNVKVNLATIMDTIIWSDGHTTTISSEEAFRRQYEFYTDNGSEWRMRIGDAEFAWHGNCWMQL